MTVAFLAIPQTQTFGLDLPTTTTTTTIRMRLAERVPRWKSTPLNDSTPPCYKLPVLLPVAFIICSVFRSSAAWMIPSAASTTVCPHRNGQLCSMSLFPQYCDLDKKAVSLFHGYTKHGDPIGLRHRKSITRRAYTDTPLETRTLSPEASVVNGGNMIHNCKSSIDHAMSLLHHQSLTTMSSLRPITSSTLASCEQRENNSHAVSSQQDDGYLASFHGITHPLDRLVLTANGNLQRMVASYYDTPVHVVIESCEMREPVMDSRIDTAAGARIWDRIVHMQVNGQTFCTASSMCTVHDAYCQSLVASGRVGLGQLFRHLNIAPEFILHDAGYNYHDEAVGNSGGGGFWRDYTLKCDALTCRIFETFAVGMWAFDQGNDMSTGDCSIPGNKCKRKKSRYLRLERRRVGWFNTSTTTGSNKRRR